MKPINLATRRWFPYLIAGAAGFLFAFASVAVLLWPSGEARREVRVPRVIGLPYPDAERRLKAEGLEVVRGADRESPDAPKNAVVAQVPAAGDVVEHGSEVVLDVSEGSVRATVPELIGRSRDDARSLLEAAGLVLGDVIEQPSETARGIILAVRPGSGVAVPRGTRISATVSGGPNELTLPDVVGREVSGARGLLEQLGFALAPLEYDSLSSLAPGTVIAQSPAAGAMVPGGSTVTLRIAGRP